jgi:hypothetical protein
MTGPEPKDSPALAELTELLRTGVAEPAKPELERGLLALRARRAKRMQARSPAGRRWLRPLAASLLVCLGLGVGLLRVYRGTSSAPAQPVAVAKIEGGRLIEGGYLAESGHAGIALSFNEGSEFRLTPGSRGRLRTVNSQGARFALEHGTASFQITKSHDHTWSVEAGPFVVNVKGTEFSVSWDPQSEQFALKLRRGRVVVSGPVLGEDLALHAGQNLTVNLPAAETVITEARLEPESDVARALPPAFASAAAAPPVAAVSGRPALPSASASTVSPSTATAVERRWNEALARGHWDRILADVERDGVDATLQTASSEELVALADAARYRRRADLARSALLAQRRRFPGSARALDAAFLLGRVEESRAGSGSVAIGWYDQYLSSAPRGTYAAEALGRKMILSNELRGPAVARPIADEYLRRFPGGSYAGAARALQRSP